MMKKMILCLIIALFVAMIPVTAFANEEDADKNVCLGKPVVLSTRYEFAPVYVNNIVDGDMYTRTSTMPQNSDGNYQWFQVDLCANYTISEVVLEIVPGCDGDPKSLAVDVYSDGKWVRVAQKYNIEAEDYPMNLYFEEIDCSYIRVATSEIAEPEAERSFVGFSEIQAYHTTNISEKEIKDSFMEVPEGKEEIPMPMAINEYFFKQGDRADYSVSPTIDESALIVTEMPYDRCTYTEQDETFVETLYGDKIQVASTSESTGVGVIDWNMVILVAGISFVAGAIVIFVVTIVLAKKRMKKTNVEV